MFKKIGIFLALLFVATSVFAAPIEVDYFEGCDTDANAQSLWVTDASAVVDQSYSETNLDDQLPLRRSGVGGFTRLGQTFQGKVGTLASVKCYLNKAGTITAGKKIWVSIYATSGNAPTGSALVTSALVEANDISSGSYNLYTFTFPTPLVMSDTRYCMSLEGDYTDDNTNYIYWGMDSSSPGYTNGQVFTYISSWDASAYDFIFYTYIIPLQSYSEATIKTQGSYALKAEAAIETEGVDKQVATVDLSTALGNIAGSLYERAGGFITTTSPLVSAIELKQFGSTGSPTGNWTVRIETDNGGKPSGTLADANASMVVTPPGNGNTVKTSFATPFTLSASTKYWIVVLCSSQSLNSYWDIGYNLTTGDGWSYRADGGAWSTGDPGDIYFKLYSLTGSLNKTLTRTLGTPLDLSGVNTLKLDMRATRTGANVKVGLHDTGGTTTEFTPTINTAGEYETKSLDISAVADADKNAIDKLIFTWVNADAANTVWFDNWDNRSNKNRVQFWY